MVEQVIIEIKKEEGVKDEPEDDENALFTFLLCLGSLMVVPLFQYSLGKL